MGNCVWRENTRSKTSQVPRKSIAAMKQITLQLLSYSFPWVTRECATSRTQNTKVLLLDAPNQLTNSSSNEMCPMASKARMWILNPLFSWLYDTKICCTSRKRASNTRYYTPVKAWTIYNQSQGTNISSLKFKVYITRSLT